LACAVTIKRFRLHRKAFERLRELPFTQLVTFMLDMGKRSTEQELIRWCSILVDEAVAGNVSSRAALSQAHKGLAEKLFDHLNGLAIATLLQWPLDAGMASLQSARKLVAPPCICLSGTRSSLPSVQSWTARPWRAARFSMTAAMC
jgi:hypothetical protein